MSKNRKLVELKKKMTLDEIESKIAKELDPSDNGYANNDYNYLEYYDVSRLNKAIAQKPEEDHEEDK